LTYPTLNRDTLKPVVMLHCFTHGRHWALRVAVGILAASGTAVLFAQVQAAHGIDAADEMVTHTHVSWPPPDSLVQGLGSKDESVRLKALLLLGFTDGEAHSELWSQSSPSAKPPSRVVVTPDHIELNYAALGDDSTLQAIVAAEVDRDQMTFAAVATPTAHGWERIATFDCWCKYEMYQDLDALAESVRLQGAPEHQPQVPERFELVLRASGGGTGIYTQNEGHFRVYHGELQAAISFVSRRRSCPGDAHYCDLEKRWFLPTPVDGQMGGVLVETRGRFATDHTPEIMWFVRNLEDRYLGAPTCTSYRWNAQVFRYELIAARSNPCERQHP
jgi:hypothetical protein